jgi:hypothetical protein
LDLALIALLSDHCSHVYNSHSFWAKSRPGKYKAMAREGAKLAKKKEIKISK